jgi:hypothetical protein
MAKDISSIESIWADFELHDSYQDLFTDFVNDEFRIEKDDIIQHLLSIGVEQIDNQKFNHLLSYWLLSEYRKNELPSDMPSDEEVTQDRMTGIYLQTFKDIMLSLDNGAIRMDDLMTNSATNHMSTITDIVTSIPEEDRNVHSYVEAYLKRDNPNIENFQNSLMKYLQLLSLTSGGTIVSADKQRDMIIFIELISKIELQKSMNALLLETMASLRADLKQALIAKQVETGSVE